MVRMPQIDISAHGAILEYSTSGTLKIEKWVEVKQRA